MEENIPVKTEGNPQSEFLFAIAAKNKPVAIRALDSVPMSPS
jgi:hypothetical protein